MTNMPTSSGRVFRSPPDAPPAAGLPRVLGPVDGAALVVANVVGIGIFITPGIVAGLVGSPAAILALWLAGGLLALAGASAYAELAARRPEAGGEFVYITDAFGPAPGFLSGWTSFVAGFSGAIAAAAVGFAEYAGRIAPFAADATPIWSVALGPLEPAVSPRTLVALAVVGAFTALHARSTRRGMSVQNVLVAGKLVIAVGLVATALVAGGGRWVHVNLAPTEAAFGGWLLALVPVMFTYSGWNAAAYVAEEMRDPERNVWRALLSGTVAVIVFYLLINVVLLYALSAQGLAREVAVADAAADRLFGSRAAAAVTMLILLALGTGLSAMIVAGPRVYLAMARAGLFPRAAARIHPSGAPRWAMYAQAGWTCVLVLTGGFVELVTYTGFAILLFSGIAVAGLFIVRRRDGPHAAVTAWGYPLVPGAFVLTCGAAVVNAIIRAPGPSLAGLAVILSGLPIYFWMAWRRGAGTSPSR